MSYRPTLRRIGHNPMIRMVGSTPRAAPKDRRRYRHRYLNLAAGFRREG